MNGRSLLVCLTALAVISAATLPPPASCAVTAPLSTQSGYNPAKTYPGSMVPNLVYYRNSPSGKWQRGLAGLFSKGVLCPDALANFKRSGTWRGHLYPDGSCGPLAEPSEWALGNRINFGAWSAGTGD
jgi:hypothetical protein